MDTIRIKRFKKKGFTRITYSDGTHEDFKSIRGSIVFPFQTAPGVILLGGMCRESETIKILVEREFATLGIAASELLALKSRFSVYQFYHQNIPEAEGPAEYLRRKANLIGRLVPAPHSEDFEYGVMLINEYLESDRLSVPQSGILANQFSANWEDINTDSRPYAVIALSCLLAALESNLLKGGFLYGLDLR